MSVTFEPSPRVEPGAPTSLNEELLLLTLEDSGGEFDSVPEIYLNCGMAGAALMDLSLRGRLDSDLSGVFVVDAGPTGDATLDLVLRMIAGEPDRLPPREWISRLSHGARHARGGDRGFMRARRPAPKRSRLHVGSQGAPLSPARRAGAHGGEETYPRLALR